MHFSDAGHAPFFPLPVRERMVVPHEDNIVPDFVNAFPWNNKILRTAKQSEKTAAPGDDERHHSAAQDIDFHVPDKPEPASVAQVDDLLAP